LEKFQIFIERTIVEGYKTPNFFLRCSNGPQTITSTIPFSVSQCKQGALIFPVASLPDVTVGYSASVPQEVVNFDPDVVFSNTDTANCPITECTLLDEDCLTPSSGSQTDLSFVGSPPMTLSVSKASILGFFFTICISCTNVLQTELISSWKVIQCGMLSPAIK
jgi:hypothetical protein